MQILTNDGVLLTEGSKFHRYNFPDPWGYGDEYRPVFPPRHGTLKAVLDNLPGTVEKLYVYGSSITLYCAMNSDLDVFMVGKLSDADLRKIILAVPDREEIDILVETEEEFIAHVKDDFNTIYRKIFEKGYKIYERKAD